MRSWDEYAARWRADRSWVAIEDRASTLPRDAYLQVIGDEWGDKPSVRGFVADFLLPHLRPDGVALEIGCGGGRVSVQVAPHCRWLIALDTAPAMMAALREAAAPLGNVVPVLMPPGSTRLPVADASLDLAFGFDAFVHFDQRTTYRYLLSLSRALRRGGVAVIHHASTETAAGWKAFLRSVVLGVTATTHARHEYLHSATLRQMAEQVGLAVAETSLGRRGNFYYERDIVALLRKGG